MKVVSSTWKTQYWILRQLDSSTWKVILLSTSLHAWVQLMTWADIMDGHNSVIWTVGHRLGIQKPVVMWWPENYSSADQPLFSSILSPLHPKIALPKLPCPFNPLYPSKKEVTGDANMSDSDIGKSRSAYDIKSWRESWSVKQPCKRSTLTITSPS